MNYFAHYSTRLSEIGELHEEIYDTVCREKMGDPIFFLLIKPDPNYGMPEDFGLTDPGANKLVKAVLLEYVTKAKATAALEGIETFHERLAAFQNEDLCSDRCGNDHDDFFGWMNPDGFNSSGNETSTS